MSATLPTIVSSQPDRVYVLRTAVDPTSYEDAAMRVESWIEAAKGRYICAANVHMVMEGYDNSEFQGIVNNADLVTPDGMPLVWCLRCWGAPGQQQVKGPELMPCLLKKAAERGWKVGLYGGEEETLRILSERLPQIFPGLDLRYVCSPPFRALSQEEDQEICEEIIAKRIQLLFVGLGCPKQERWMADHRPKLNCVMVGVGAAFNFHAGTVRPVPEGLRRIGFEWFFRLCMEPKRLWRRYAKHNPRFILHVIRQLRQVQELANRFDHGKAMDE
ncbi:MAG: glycosyltransferase [Verrucomicrobiaceae bacterium]|nr:MAG: glycosyltransferase [Verrucomicrobiaceae bacterium]